MRLGFRHTAFQAVCTVLVLCFALGLLERADTVQPVFGEDSVRVPILMYHSILKDSARQGKYVISPAVLAADLDALQEKGYTAVTVSDLLAYVQDGADLPEKPVMLTFDDGYYNNYIYAYPLLKQRGMKAVVSIIGSQTALFTDNGEENAYWSHLRLDRLREMQDVFEVQNHSWNLHEYGERRGCLRRRGEDETRYETLLREDTEQTRRSSRTPACPRRPAIPIRSARAPKRAKRCSKAWASGVRSGARSASIPLHAIRTACLSWGGSTVRRAEHGKFPAPRVRRGLNAEYHAIFRAALP